MPVSGKEEPGSKPHVSHSSDSSAGVPLKKRRFLLVQPPSSPPQAPTSVENDSLKHRSSECNEPYLSTTNLATSSSDLSDTNKSSMSEGRRQCSVNTSINMVQSHANLSRVKVEEEIHISPVPIVNIDGKEKLMSDDKISGKITSKITELQLAPTISAREEVCGRQKAPVNCKPELHAVLGGTELSLGKRVSLLPDLTESKFKEKFLQPEKLDPSSLNLCLSGIKNDNQSKSADIESNINGSHLRANRSNWDLNTTMDAWEGSMAYSFSGKGTKATAQTDSSLSLHLNTSYLQTEASSVHSSSSAKEVSSGVNPDLSLPSKLSLGSSSVTSSHNCGPVKPEPLDATDRSGLEGDKQPNFLGSLNSTSVNGECSESVNFELLKSSNFSILKSYDRIPVKSEPIHEVSHSRIVFNATPVTNPEGSTPRKVVFVTKEASKEECESPEKVASGTFSAPLGQTSRQLNNSDVTLERPSATVLDFSNPELCKTRSVDEVPIVSREIAEGSVLSEDEKFNVSAELLEEDSYGTDYDSDGNHALGVAASRDINDKHCHREDDDYEDGEVRREVLRPLREIPFSEQEDDCINQGVSEKKTYSIYSCSENLASSPIEEKDAETKNPEEKCNAQSEENFHDIEVERKTDEGIEVKCLQEPQVVEMPDEKTIVKTARREPLDVPGKKDISKDPEGKQSFDQATSGNHEITVTVDQVADDNIKEIEPVEKTKSILLKVEASFNGDEAGKDLNANCGGGNKSRIINLARPSSNVKAKTFPDRSLSLQTGRDRYNDFVQDGDKLHSRGIREDNYFGGPRNFVRESNSRPNTWRGRGRHSQRGDWDSDRNFAPEIYDDSSDYQYHRHKHASSGSDADGYIIEQDSTVPNSGRGRGRGRGRNQLHDDLPAFRSMYSRRRSPSFQMIRRIPRNISPSRCIGEDGYNGKFMRRLSDDMAEPIFDRPQPSYEGSNDHFDPRNRNFSLQRRCIPTIHSKSPIRSSTRSPGPWSSPRRSLEGYNGHSEMPNRRSSPRYRIERIQSPDRRRFGGELMPRRDSSPPYFNPNRRSPSGRVFPRGNKRFDGLENGDYFDGGAIRTGRIHEFGGDGSGDERRKFGAERRGPIRPFRGPYNGGDGESYRFRGEDGPSRPFRFCPEGDSDFHERGNSLREREFERRIKSRPGNGPRRARSIEDQDGNYRHGEEGWQDDDTRGKRRRF